MGILGNILPGLVGGARGMANQATILEAERMKKEAEARAFARQQQTSSQDFERRKALETLLASLRDENAAKAVTREQERPRSMAELVALKQALQSGRLAGSQDERAAADAAREAELHEERLTPEQDYQQRLEIARVRSTLPRQPIPDTPLDTIKARDAQIKTILQRAKEIEVASRKEIQSEIDALQDPSTMAVTGTTPDEAAARINELRERLVTISEDSREAAKRDVEALSASGSAPAPELTDADRLQSGVQQAFMDGDPPLLVYQELIQIGVPVDEAKSLIEGTYGEGALNPAPTTGPLAPQTQIRSGE